MTVARLVTLVDVNVDRADAHTMSV